MDPIILLARLKPKVYFPWSMLCSDLQIISVTSFSPSVQSSPVFVSMRTCMWTTVI